MKKKQWAQWLFIGAVSSSLFACQSKTMEPNPKKVVPCDGPNCPAPPEAPYEDKVPCREGECDDTEAMLHVIEIPDAAEEKSAAVETAPTEEKSASKEEAPVNNVSIQAPVEAPAKEASKETSQSPEIKFEEPTTQIFEEMPHNPVSENTVVLLKE